MKSDVIVAIVVQNKMSEPRVELPHFVFHGTQHWTVTQIHEAFIQIHYMKIQDFNYGKGKKDPKNKATLTVFNAVSLGGVATFFEQAAAAISTKCVSFIEASPAKSIAADTLKKIWKEKVSYRTSQRLSWGKGPCAFNPTGDGDFPNPDPNHESLSHLAGSEKERFEVAYTCVQIDDLLDAYLQVEAEQELARREKRSRPGETAASALPLNSNRSDESLSSLEVLDSNGLQLIVRQPNQHSFGTPMLPAAPEGSVSGAASKTRNQHDGKMTAAANVTKRQKDDTSAVHKVLDFGTAVTGLGVSMMERMKRPTVEEEVSKYSAVSQAVVQVVSTAVVDAVKEWKKPAEIQAPKSSLLLRMTPQVLLQAIKDSGEMFASYPQLASNILSAGLDGATIARMSDADVKEFLISDCQVKTIHANILIAKLACWRDLP
jgi:hypothetical protein